MKRAIAFISAGLVMLSAQLAHAQSADLDRAKTFFNAGARAYDAGDFSTAIDAFEAAEKLAPRPAIQFSIAQAHRRQYFLDGKPEHLRTAIQNYREYVDATPPGQGRRADAAQALTDLVPIADKLAPESGPRVTEPKHTKINVSSPAPGARVSCDGGKLTEPGAPLTLEVKAGKHQCSVSADGFFDEKREVLAVEGEFVPVEVVLVERPAQLRVTGADGAEISIDGRTVGNAASSARIPIAAGVHLVAVARNGHAAFVREIEFSRGQEKTLALDLGSTAQRKIARGALVLGAAGIVTGAVFTVVALIEEGRAKDVLDKSNSQNLTGPDLATYDSARNARTTWTDAAIIGYGAGAALAATGLVLYLFDSPNTTNPSLPPDSKPQPVSVPRHGEPTEIGAAPIVAPGFVGGSFKLRF